MYQFKEQFDAEAAEAKGQVRIDHFMIFSQILSLTFHKKEMAFVNKTEKSFYF